MLNLTLLLLLLLLPSVCVPVDDQLLREELSSKLDALSIMFTIGEVLVFLDVINYN